MRGVSEGVRGMWEMRKGVKGWVRRGERESEREIKRL